MTRCGHGLEEGQTSSSKGKESVNCLVCTGIWGKYSVFLWHIQWYLSKNFWANIVVFLANRVVFGARTVIFFLAEIAVFWANTVVFCGRNCFTLGKNRGIFVADTMFCGANTVAFG